MNILLDNFFYFWFSVSFFFLIAEMVYPGLFFFLSFFFGGLLAGFVSIATQSLIFQAGAFLLGASCALIVLRYFILPMITREHAHTQTNIFALKGKRGLVLKNITSSKMGLVKIDGETWSARCAYGKAIDEGSIVEIINVRGAHVIVKKI